VTDAAFNGAGAQLGAGVEEGDVRSAPSLCEQACSPVVGPVVAESDRTEDTPRVPALATPAAVASTKEIAARASSGVGGSRVYEAVQVRSAVVRHDHEVDGGFRSRRDCPRLLVSPAHGVFA